MIVQRVNCLLAYRRLDSYSPICDIHGLHVAFGYRPQFQHAHQQWNWLSCAAQKRSLTADVPVIEHSGLRNTGGIWRRISSVPVILCRKQRALVVQFLAVMSNLNRLKCLNYCLNWICLHISTQQPSCCKLLFEVDSVWRMGRKSQ